MASFILCDNAGRDRSRGFYSSYKMQEYKPSIRESENHEYPGRYKYGLAFSSNAGIRFILQQGQLIPFHKKYDTDSQGIWHWTKQMYR
ncbi:hypothetical protein GXM_09867 [Nostoc sphaeroides CCNUC1]|uniref:Uncharacterized protein n=1 Tax=Nostoc sphaeroides CCNUC1 TaxID=2653204 RepID=A0A5P8WHN7_9NOSO|nr:hypothetical protein GXM_09867 [Nostoc sphaeroides CCNUC1]